MELERVRASLRPRRPWEALDLGFAFGRIWFRSLWPLWCLGAAPFAALWFLAVGGRADLWILALWWLKPLYEAPLVVWVGRALFGETPALRETGPVLRVAWSGRLLPFLLWRRLGFSRSLLMPIALLEGLRGRAVSQRRRVLNDGHGTAAWLTVICTHFEAILWGGFLLTAFVMIPEGLPRLDLGSALLESGSWPYWLSGVLAVLTFSVIAPFYVCAGFALYLSRRTELEAWDLDLAFRQPWGPGTKAPVERLRRRPAVGARLVLAALLVVGTAGPWSSGDAVAQHFPGPEESRRLIDEVLADESFGSTRAINVWVPTQWPAETDPETPDWLRRLGDHAVILARIIKWLLAILAFAALVLLARRILRDWRPRIRARRPAAVGDPGPVLDRATAESLPLDLAGAVRARLAAGDQRGAVALLYRAAIASLGRHAVEVSQGATESECLALAARRLPAGDLVPLHDLTRTWQSLAYAHRSLGPDAIERRLGQWLAWIEAEVEAAPGGGALSGGVDGGA